MLELAARSIGGLCSRALQFPGDRSLEELAARAARTSSVTVTPTTTSTRHSSSSQAAVARL
jgi:hypothetical protein